MNLHLLFNLYNLYVCVAIIAFLVGVVLTIYDKATGVGGFPATPVGWLGLLIVAAILSAFWLPVVVIGGLLFLFVMVDDKLHEWRLVARARAQRKANNVCVECDRPLSSATYDPEHYKVVRKTKHVYDPFYDKVISIAEFKRLTDIEREFKKLNKAYNKRVMEWHDHPKKYEHPVPTEAIYGCYCLHCDALRRSKGLIGER